MRRIMLWILTAGLVFALTACAGGKPVAEQTPTQGASAPTEFRICSLKGPTSMGLVKLLDDQKNGNTENRYISNIVTGADEVTAALVSGKTDIAMLPANAAATLYQKAGGFTVAAINTLGVLYVVENGDTVHSTEDLAGKTVCLTGKGTTPEYALRYLLAAHGIEDRVKLEFKSEPAEVVTVMTEDVAAVGLLPQPFAASALMQNKTLRIALDLTEEWAAVSADGPLVTGVTVVRSEIMEKYPAQVEAFLREYAASVDYVNQNPAQAAVWIEELGIVGKAVIAENALPYCNLVCITGADMRTTLAGYLQTLYDRDPDAVGGAMPDEDFYFVK